MNDLSKSLVPTKEEIAEILMRVLQAQIEKPDPMKVPMAISQAWADCMVRKAVKRVEGEYGKASDEFMDEVTRSFEQFMNKLAETVKKLEDELSRSVSMIR